MHAWIALDGEKSTAVEGLEVLAYTPPLLAPRTRQETVIPGRVAALAQREWQREPVDLEIILALVGDDMQAMLNAWQTQALPWLYDAARLELDAMPGYFFRGAVTEAVIEEQTDAWLRARVVFRCNPPLPLRLRSGQANWFPQADLPISQQITAQTATAGASFSAPGVLPIPQGVGGRESAETYLAVTGSWTELHLGASFAVLEAAAGATLYIDCEHAQVWRVEADGTEVNMMGVTTGELPELRPGATGLQVGGSGLQVTVRVLLIERG